MVNPLPLWYRSSCIRKLTINAMLWNIETQQLGSFSGSGDLQNRILKATHETFCRDYESLEWLNLLDDCNVTLIPNYKPFVKR